VALGALGADEWGLHEKIGDTPQGWAIHAMVLDMTSAAAADPQSPEPR